MWEHEWDLAEELALARPDGAGGAAPPHTTLRVELAHRPHSSTVAGSGAPAAGVAAAGPRSAALAATDPLRKRVSFRMAARLGGGSFLHGAASPTSTKMPLLLEEEPAAEAAPEPESAIDEFDQAMALWRSGLSRYTRTHARIVAAGPNL